jgi:alpha 1,2-mannosyltransferase
MGIASQLRAVIVARNKAYDTVYDEDDAKGKTTKVIFTHLRQTLQWKKILLSSLLVGLFIYFLHRKVEESHLDYVDLTEGYPLFKQSVNTTVKQNATFVILVRNNEAQALAGTLRDFEAKFNSRYHYPYVFLNDEPFTQEFKDVIEPIVSGVIEYGQVPYNEWSFPPWINETKAYEEMAKMEENNVRYAGMLSYHHMCRYNSGFFFRHPLMNKYNYYWRIEPGVKFTCGFEYDPFAYMAENKKIYGFVVSFDEIPQSIPSLWDSVERYIETRNLKPSWMNFFRADDGGYNMCHFWSNFEIGDLRFYRSPQYLDFFNYLDQEGGFFYERWGDAPVHSLALGLFLRKEEVHFFHDIGYFHDPYGYCPPSNADYRYQCDECPGYVTIRHQRNCIGHFLRYQPELDESGIRPFPVEKY